MSYRIAVFVGLVVLAGCQGRRFPPAEVSLPPNAVLVCYKGEDCSIANDWSSPCNGCLYYYREDKRRVVVVEPIAAGASRSLTIEANERVYFVPDTVAATQPAK